MKKIALLLAAATLALSAPAYGQALSLLRALGDLGVSPAQAIGGSKALLGIARGNLGSEEFSQLLGSVPQFGQVLEMTGNDGGVAGALGGIRRGGDASADDGGEDAEPIAPVELPAGALDALMSNAELVSQFGDLGMDAAMIGKFAPTLLGVASKAGGVNSLGLLRKGLGIL